MYINPLVNGELYERETWVPATRERDASFWPTAVVNGKRLTGGIELGNDDV
jgi:hypothetical protein